MRAWSQVSVILMFIGIFGTVSCGPEYDSSRLQKRISRLENKKVDPIQLHVWGMSQLMAPPSQSGHVHPPETLTKALGFRPTASIGLDGQNHSFVFVYFSMGMEAEWLVIGPTNTVPELNGTVVTWIPGVYLFLGHN